MSIKTAHQYVNAYWEEIKDNTAELAEQVREIELASLDRMSRRWAPVALESEDNELALKVTDRLLKIQERRAKLLGLEAPAKVDMTTRVRLIGYFIQRSWTRS
ncbi:MAG: hypothetical protein M3463_07645 [Verrucomicrobiota bacterium]|nr:hypothetical protein [Verrucomicrobiota bacterium]